MIRVLQHLNVMNEYSTGGSVVKDATHHTSFLTEASSRDTGVIGQNRLSGEDKDPETTLPVPRLGALIPNTHSTLFSSPGNIPVCSLRL